MKPSDLTRAWRTSCQVTLERGAQPTGPQSRRALKASGLAMEGLFEIFAREGKVKRWAESPENVLGHHCADHRALAIVSLRLWESPLPSVIQFDRWTRWRKPKS